MNITLQQWATRTFDPAPGMATLRSWARQNRIQRQPVKVGRTWYVDEHAQYCPAGPVQAGCGVAGMSERAAVVFREAA